MYCLEGVGKNEGAATVDVCVGLAGEIGFAPVAPVGAGKSDGEGNIFVGVGRLDAAAGIAVGVCCWGTNIGRWPTLTGVVGVVAPIVGVC